MIKKNKLKKNLNESEKFKQIKIIIDYQINLFNYIFSVHNYIKSKIFEKFYRIIINKFNTQNMIDIYK